MGNRDYSITKQFFYAPEPYWQVVNTSEGLKLIHSKLDYAACTIHLQNCFELNYKSLENHE